MVLSVDARLPARAFVARRDAFEELRDRDRFDGQVAAAALEPREVEQILDDALEPRRFVGDDAHVTCTRGRIQIEFGHAERFEIAPHGCDRGVQFVGDVGEQLTARAIRGGERVGSRRQVVGHRVERAGDGGDLVAAANRRAR